MKQAAIALALVLVACLFGVGSAQCACNDTACRATELQNNPTTQSCCTWVPQPIDTSSESLNDPNGTPLGFMLDTYRGTDSNQPDLCVTVNFQTPLRNIRYVVVSVQSDTQICIQRRNAGPDDEATCGNEAVFFCRSYTSGSSIELNIFCTGGSCPVNDEVFYFRPTATSLDTDDEFFCDNINRTLPRSLVQDPGNPDVGVNPSQNPNSSATFVTSHLLPALLLAMMLVTMMVLQ